MDPATTIDHVLGLKNSTLSRGGRKLRFLENDFGHAIFRGKDRRGRRSVLQPDLGLYLLRLFDRFESDKI